MTDRFRHRRIPHPQPSSKGWILDCSCGWRAAVSPYRRPPAKPATREECEAELNRQFIDHVPAAERRSYVLVDQRPGHEANWLMPEGIEVKFHGWRDHAGTFYATISLPGEAPFEMIVGEIRIADGRVFRTE